jgi:hypothetical protein
MVDFHPSTVWQKSPRCDSGSCVEVAQVPDGFFVRDSKDPDGAVLKFTRPEWDAFVESIRDGDFQF